MIQNSLGVVIVLVLVGFGGYLLFLQTQPSSLSQEKNSAKPSLAPKIIDKLWENGSTYQDEQGLYKFLYPMDYKLDKQVEDKHIRVYKIGETQQADTELYDGVTIAFETIQLQEKTLEQWVNASITKATIDGMVKVVTPKKKITQNTYPGFSYTLEGLGTANYYVLQKNTTSKHALVITTSVNDPQQKGYQKEVNTILSSLKLLR